MKSKDEGGRMKAEGKGARMKAEGKEARMKAGEGSPKERTPANRCGAPSFILHPSSFILG
jgi:hypothetical protein